MQRMAQVKFATCRQFSGEELTDCSLQQQSGLLIVARFLLNCHLISSSMKHHRCSIESAAAAHVYWHLEKRKLINLISRLIDEGQGVVTFGRDNENCQRFLQKLD